MSQILFSIIVPLYNSEKYINSCIESVVNQTYSNWELILVDDGSTDNSQAICLERAQKDKRIKYYYKDNSGQNDSRIYGLQKSRGEYCIWLDSDDMLKKNALDKLDNILSVMKCDCIIYGLERELPGKRCEVWKDDDIQIENNRKKLLVKLLRESRYNSLCRKAIKRSILLKSEFPKESSIRNGEDLLLSVNILKNVNGVVFIPDVLYFYRYNSTSITYRIKYDKLIEDTLYVDRYVFDFLENEGLFDDTDIHILTIPYLFRIIDIIRGVCSHCNKTDANHIMELILDSIFYKKYIMLKPYQNQELKLRFIYFFLLKKKRYYLIRLLEKIYILFQKASLNL